MDAKKKAKLRQQIKALVEDSIAPLVNECITQRLTQYAEVLHGQLRTAPAGDEGWQPIETAPKDGETRLLFWDCDWEEAFIGFRPVDCPDNACCDATHIACWPHFWRPLPAAPHAARAADREEG